MGIYLVFAFFISMCFSYSKFFVIFENKSALNSLSASTGLAVRHINITGRLYFTMILLYLRTIIIGLIFLWLPFVISSIIAFFTILTVKYIFLGIFALVSIVLFIFIVHLNSTLEIFVEATWYEAYQLCKKEDAEYGNNHSETHGHDHDHDTQKNDHTHSHH